MTYRYLIDQALKAYQNGQTQDLEHILKVLADRVALAPIITATPNMLVECAKCHDIEAPEYRLRRVMGRYALLCFRNGEGCWEHSPRPTCSFKDEQGVQCVFPAEARVAYGEDQVETMAVCALHVGACLTPVCGKITVYPIEV